MVMRRSTLLWLAAGLYAPASVALPSPAAAGDGVRAYVLVDAQPGQLEAARNALDGLGNCLALDHHFMGDEIIAHLDCDEPKYLTVAVTGKIGGNPAVAGVTILAVRKRN
jgi:hypothetical protein